MLKLLRNAWRLGQGVFYLLLTLVVCVILLGLFGWSAPFLAGLGMDPRVVLMAYKANNALAQSNIIPNALEATASAAESSTTWGPRLLQAGNVWTQACFSSWFIPLAAVVFLVAVRGRKLLGLISGENLMKLTSKQALPFWLGLLGLGLLGWQVYTSGGLNALLRENVTLLGIITVAVLGWVWWTAGGGAEKVHQTLESVATVVAVGLGLLLVLGALTASQSGVAPNVTGLPVLDPLFAWVSGIGSTVPSPTLFALVLLMAMVLMSRKNGNGSNGNGNGKDPGNGG